MDREQQFATLTGMLARYEPGDLLLLSDLMDALMGLEDFFMPSPVCSDFIAWIHAWLRQNLNGSAHDDVAARLGQALDLLQRWKPKLGPAAKKRIEAEMLGFHPEAPAIPEARPAPPRGAAEPLEPPASTSNDIFQSAETFAIFLVEARERLSQAQELVLVLEARPDDAESLAALFRVFHTIKGESGFLHLTHLGDLTHRLENILDLLRNHKLDINRSLVDLLLAGVDRSLLIIERLEAGERDMVVDQDLAAFLEELNQLSSRIQPSLGSVLVKSGKLQEKDVAAILEKQRSGVFSERFGEIAVKEQFISDQDLRKALANQSQDKDADHGKSASPSLQDSLQDEIIKVRLGKVNYLVDMIGELTIALGQVAEDSLAVAQVKKITRGLQFGAMELRTDSMQGLFSTARRIIRDLSHTLDKDVEIKTEGERVEIDRNLIKKLEEPLMHLVRNSLDHGLESAAERLARGKPARGTISISAVRKGSTIVIKVEDDGQGLDRGRILAKAIERGLVGAEAGAKLGDAQIFEFIFQAGFSTSQAISTVSGRGVGMDIVRSMVIASRGTIRIETEAGKGTAFIMNFPISTAIIDGLLVRVKGNILVVPVNSVVESLKVPLSSLTRIGINANLVTIREKVMPVLRLDEALGLEAKSRQDQGLGIAASLAAGAADGSALPNHLIGLIVENADHQNYFLVIDEVIAKKEVVVKPLGPRFRNLRGITSGTVLAGGTIGLVLDVDQIVNLDRAKPDGSPD